MQPGRNPKPFLTESIGRLEELPPGQTAIGSRGRRRPPERAGALHTGSLAEAIVSQVQGSTNPGSLALSDLRGYEARERTPVCAAYECWRVCGVPPPSAGGIAIAQILGMLQALEARDSRWSLAKLPPIAAPTLAGAEPRPEAVT